MPLPEFGDPLAYMVALIASAFPSAIVTGDPKRWNGWSNVRRGVQFVFVQVQGGSTPSWLLQTDVRLEIQSYVHDEDASVGSHTLFAQGIERAIRLAAFDQLVFAGGHARRPVTEVRPYHQAILGLPASITRFSGTYTIGYRSREPESS